ncbi:MAG: nucleoside monophosphate kinase [Candidatus Paceibacterota bacterium]|jgi:adenylate kinase family enzyme
MSPQTFIFYGRSGCGKGTQADLLIKHLEKIDPNHKVLYAETGNLLRTFAARDGYSNKLVGNVLETGGLLPEFMSIFVWSQFLTENLTNNEHLVFDGVCRRPLEAPVFDSALVFYKREKPIVILIEVSRDWAKARLLARHRSDDDLSEVERRLAWYETDVIPTLKFFENNPNYRFLKINGEQTIEKVHQEIIEKISNS